MYSRQIRRLIQAAVAASMGLSAALAQTQDATGNGLLKGNFHFRHLAVQIVDANFDPSDITAVYGAIAFDGAGNYTLTATSIDNGVAGGAPQPLNLSGTYAIGSNGLGYLTNPLYPADANAFIYGAVAQGVFIGSSTESQQDQNTLNDIFIAIPAGSPPANSAFTTPYQTGLLDFSGANGAAIKNALFALKPDGKGGFADINLNGQASNQAVSTVTQTVTGATYNFSGDGTATLTIPQPASVTSTANALFTGTRTLVVSSDGAFILGWSANGYDLFFGVKALTSPADNKMSTGLYFTAAVEDNQSGNGTDSYYGSTNNTGNTNGDAIVHERVNAPLQSSFDFGADDRINLNADGTTPTDLGGYSYIFGDGGQAFVAVGVNALYSLQIGIHAPAFSGPGVYLNPIGIANAASFQPITASIAPGELIVLYGTGLASASMSAAGGVAFPVSLGGVSVTINGIPCPLFYVTSGQISVVVPYEVASNQTGLANIQVTNRGVASNIVQTYLTDSSPASFSQNASGIGLAAAIHAATGALITSDNPAQSGEFVSLFLTGVGTVTPTITDGAVGPTSPLSWSDLFEAGNLQVLFSDVAGGGGGSGNIEFAGLAPTLAGLYQINAQVPFGLGSGGNLYVGFVTDAAVSNQIQIPFGSVGGGRSVAAETRLAKVAAIQQRRLSAPAKSHRTKRGAPRVPADSAEIPAR